ncbi:MAG TPA: phosphoserine aminotransferase [Microscillaceae bacterium]|nr:phosphoserine aminotransferase [Microscillaceae bacterium]
MNPKIFFTPGPAAIYPTVAQHTQNAFAEQIPSISHRSPAFQAIYQQTYENIREIFQLPDDYAVLFTGSATEVWERLLQNCVAHETFHLVNGSFSRRFYDFALLLNKMPHLHEVLWGQGFDLAQIEVPTNVEMICVTHNETSTGVSMPVADIHALKDRYPDKLLVVDMVSSAPIPMLDFTKIDAAYFSVQKAFGLPAGLGVWLVNRRCLEKAQTLEDQGQVTGTYHRLTNLWKSFEKFQTPPTPNVLGLYLLSKVTQDLLHKGIRQIRQETNTKAQLLYNAIEAMDGLEIFVKNPDHRSEVVVVANTQGNATELIQKLADQNMVIGSGYGQNKTSQIRVANFPATSLTEVEELLEIMQKTM